MQIIIFDFQGKQYAINTEKVEEISKPLEITPVPKAPNYIKGLINLRGNVISLLEISELLNITDLEEDHSNIIIATLDGEMIGMQVGEVREVMNIEEDAIERIELNDDGPKGIKGIIRIGGRIINLLELEGLLA